MSRRIVSLAPSITEIIFALASHDKLVGVTSYCQYPPKIIELVRTRRLRTVGGYSEPKLDRIVDLGPDMIISTSHIRKDTIEDIQKQGLTILVVDYPKSIEELLQSIHWIGRSIDAENEAALLIKGLRERVEFVKQKVKLKGARSVFLELSYDPVRTVGGRIWLGDMIRIAGGTNIFEDHKDPYPIVEANEVLSRDPEVILVSVDRMGEEEQLYARAGWQAVSAVRGRRVFGLDSDVVGKPTPRAIGLLEEIGKHLASDKD